MDQKLLFDALLAASTIEDVASALETFEDAQRNRVGWVPVGGKENNRGPIEVSADPGRSLVERLTNSIDAVLELEHELHRGMPDCRSPPSCDGLGQCAGAGPLRDDTRAAPGPGGSSEDQALTWRRAG
jgi:hypothetical protein